MFPWTRCLFHTCGPAILIQPKIGRSRTLKMMVCEPCMIPLWWFYDGFIMVYARSTNRLWLWKATETTGPFRGHQATTLHLAGESFQHGFVSSGTMYISRWTNPFFNGLNPHFLNGILYVLFLDLPAMNQWIPTNQKVRNSVTIHISNNCANWVDRFNNRHFLY